MSMTSTAQSIRAPSMLLALTELHRASFEMGLLPLAAPILASAPRGDGHPVLVLPGFIASDVSTRVMRRYLKALGYQAHDWSLGRNLGPKVLGPKGQLLSERLRTIFETTGQKVSLIGWSLGGVMARELATRHPDWVRQVISLGSPFTGDPKATTVGKLYERVTGENLSGSQAKRRLKRGAKPPPAPSTAIFSRADGVVAWQNCIETCSPLTDNIEVYGSHCGLVSNPAVLYAIADRLAQDEDAWAPFDRAGLKSAFYPSSGHLN